MSRIGSDDDPFCHPNDDWEAAINKISSRWVCVQYNLKLVCSASLVGEDLKVYHMYLYTCGMITEYI